ncbi:MAG: 30S ribosomal protein S5 [Planctomycetota bacterium]|nr:MAG: 30S ribosomal protein S5 [Planctomycetota bacterium]
MARLDTRRSRDREASPFTEKVIRISRVATVVKGGRRFSFNALVVVGDHQGKVAYGFGKAKEVPLAVEKAVKNAHKNLIQVPIVDHTIPHQYLGRYGASKVLLLPARPGTGIIAGPALHALLSVSGIHNILTKSFGSNNPINLVKAALEGLKAMRTKEQVEKLRGVSLDVDVFQ